MFKQYLDQIKSTWAEVRLKVRIKALDKVIEHSMTIRDKAKQAAVHAQTERDELQVRLTALAK